MKYIFSAVAMASMVAFAGSVGASEVLLTQGNAKTSSGMQTIALDIVSDGDATAFDFAIPLPANTARTGISPKRIDLSGCLADLPKTHTGGCAYRSKKNDIAVFVYSPSNALLPKGVIGLGMITVPAEMAKSFAVDDAEFSSPEGKVIRSTHK